MKYTAILLQSHRLTKDFPRRYVAKILKVSPQFYGLVEQGKVKLPPIYFKKIMRLLAIPESYLLESLVSDFKNEVNKYL